jgi:NAD(P)-dependent dehydrogenase (short-subunit alcohol dehydrogenase family)
VSAVPTILDAFRLEARVAILTGASSGLGVAFARALAEADAGAQPWTGREGIRVNAAAPGFFDPRELAATVVFLASSASGYVTGQTLPVEGGMTIT